MRAESKVGNVAEAVAIFAPVVRALVIEAEASGRSGPEKHAAVAEGSERLYRLLQNSVKELRGVPWELIEPIVVGAADSLISVLVSVFNTLLGRAWGWLSSFASSGDE